MSPSPLVDARRAAAYAAQDARIAAAVALHPSTRCNPRRAAAASLAAKYAQRRAIESRMAADRAGREARNQ